MAATLTTQNTANQTFGLSANCSITINSGDLIAVLLRERDGATPSSVTSSVDGALTQAVYYYNGNQSASIYYRKNCTSGAHTVTVTYGGNAVFTFNASAWGGCATTGTTDATGTQYDASGTSHTCGSFTPSAAALVLACAVHDSDASTAGTGYTELTNPGDRSIFMYQVGVTGATTGPFTTTTSLETTGCMAAFLESGGGGGTPTIPSTPAMAPRRLPRVPIAYH